MKTIALLSAPILLLSACAADPPRDLPPPARTGQTIALAGQALFTVNSEDHSLVAVPVGGGEPVRHVLGGRPTRVIATADRVYVSLRSQRVVLVLSHAEEGRKVEPIARIEVGHEPFGLALSPDGARLFVAASLSDEVVEVDTARLQVAQRWSVRGEPRWLALHPSGRTLFVGTLMNGMKYLDPQTGEQGEVSTGRLPDRFQMGHLRVIGDPAVSPDGLALVVPMLDIDVTTIPSSAAYYGTFEVVVPYISEIELIPVDGRPKDGDPYLVVVPKEVGPSLASVSFTAGSELMVVASDAGGQAVVFPTLATRRAGATDVRSTAWAQKDLRGLSGVVFDEVGRGYGARFLDRGISRLDLDADGPILDTTVVDTQAATLVAEELASWSTGLPEEVERGRRLFHDATNRGMTSGTAVCATCHVDGRSDNVTWQLGQGARQTRTLAEPVKSQAPLGWDADRADVADGAQQTALRMGGSGLDARDAQAVQAFVDTLDVPDFPTRGQVSAEVERGRELFVELGCVSCHAGDAHTDRTVHMLLGRPGVATPSLRGVAITGPYFHDGSAATLEMVLTLGPSLGKGPTDRLTSTERAALLAYLRSL